ncbi:MAG: packaged DNA stabilization gp4 family protein [Pikeienuella sp.]
MTTVSEIVTAAYRKLNIASEDEDLAGETLSRGVEEFNRMIHGWKLRGVDTGHTTQVAGDTFPLASEYEEGAVYVLASRISPAYEAPANFDADDWFRAIQAAYAEIDEVDFDLAVQRPPSWHTPSQALKGWRY